MFRINEISFVCVVLCMWYMQVCLQMCVHMYVHVQSPSSTLGIFPHLLTPFFLFFEIGFFTKSEIRMFSWLHNELEGSSCLCVPSGQGWDYGLMTS